MSLDVDIRAQRGGFTVHGAFSVDAGQTMALLGPNGAGKSTLVAALAGLIECEGSIELEGEPLHERPPEDRPIGIAFQGGLLLPHMSALDNVAFPLRARGVGRSASRRRALDSLERLAPSVRPQARPSSLSGGEAQRVSLARAVVHRPRLLLLDEPTSSLDVAGRVEIRPTLVEVLRSFPGERILVTHDPVEAMTLADRVTILEQGEVTQSGTFDEIRRAPKSRYAADLVGVNLLRGRLEPIAGGGRLALEEGAVIVAWPDDVARRPFEPVIATLRPSDIVLHLSPPEAASARNALPGRVEEVAISGDRAHVRISSRPPLVAELTTDSVTRLGLVRGAFVWASFKAVEVSVTLI